MCGLRLEIACAAVRSTRRSGRILDSCVVWGVWKPVFDRGRSVRQEHGSTGEIVFRNGNDVMAIVEFPDLAAQEAFRADPRLQEGMQEGGVMTAPEISGPWTRVS